MGGDAEKWAADGEFNGFSLTEYFKAKKRRPEEQLAPRSARTCSRTRHGFSEFLEMLRGKLTDQMKLQIVAGQKPPFPYRRRCSPRRSRTRFGTWPTLPLASRCVTPAERTLLQGLRDRRRRRQRRWAGCGRQAAGRGRHRQARPRTTGTGSITLSCGKLMTGVTVREWGAILMLRSLKSPETYFQSAFRVQSPWSERAARTAGRDGATRDLATSSSSTRTGR